MNIPVTALKRFQKLSAHIRPLGILPSSDYIKFGGGSIARNASSAFVAFDCQESNEDVLVNEKILWPLLNQTLSSFISITTNSQKTTLSDGRDRIPCAYIPSKEWAAIPATDTEKQPISADFLAALGRVTEACADFKDPATLYMYVHVGNKSACAANGFTGVCVPIEEGYKMVLEAKTCHIISKSEPTTFAESQGHYFFFGADFLMGFSKQEIGFSDLKKVIVNEKTERAFSLAASDLFSFNSLALSISKEFGIVTMSNGKLEMVDTVTEISQIREVEGLKIVESFSYNPVNMNKAIKCMDAEELDFHEGKGLYYIKSKDSNATAIIAKINK